MKKIIVYIFNKLSLKPLFISIFRKGQYSIIIRHLFRLPNKKQSDSIHLDSAISWLRNAHEAVGNQGVAAEYSFEIGWGLPYPETTGYIIPTFLRYSELVNKNEYLDRAIKMGEWEIDIQMQNGAVRGGAGVNDYPIVFNTGMVILGWVELYKKTKQKKFLDAAIRAADWLCLNINDDGTWSKFTYLNIEHSYHSRVAWSLLEVFDLTKNIRYSESAIKNIEWILSLTSENSWIGKMGFTHEENPFTHTIAYTLRGLLESSHFVDAKLKTKIYNTVYEASSRILHLYEVRKKHPNGQPKILPGRISMNWKAASTYSCLTGNAQLAIIWLKIYKISDDARFLNSALKIVDQLKDIQDINSKNPGIRGGIPGSYPIWGEYMPFSYPNWAAKFFADAIIVQESIMNELDN